MHRNAYRLAAAAMVAVAAVLIAAGVADGSLKIGFLLIVPVIYGSGVYAIVAALLVFGAFALFAFSAALPESGSGSQGYADWHDAEKEQAQFRGRRRFGGIIFIGPIPIIFGSDRKLGAYLITAAIAVLVLLIIAFVVGYL